VRRIAATGRALPPTYSSPPQTRPSWNLEEVISVDTWQVDADVPTRATSRLQQALSKLVLFRKGQFRQDLPIRVIGGRRTLHGKAKEKVANEEDGVEEGRSESASDPCRLQGPPP